MPTPYTPRNASEKWGNITPTFCGQSVDVGLITRRRQEVGHLPLSKNQRLTELYRKISPEALAALQKADVERWVSIIKAANIKGE